MSEICIYDAIADAVDEKRRQNSFPVKAILGPDHMFALFKLARDLKLQCDGVPFFGATYFMGLEIEFGSTPGIQIVCDEE